MANLKLGWGIREFSIDKPVNIPGLSYYRKSKGILDPLCATALAIDGGKDNGSVIFCSMDVTAIRGGIIIDVKEYFEKNRPDIPAENIIMSATHTHTSMDMSSSSDTFPDGSPLCNRDVVQPLMVNAAVEAITEAWDSRTEGGIAYGYGYAVVGHSRRTVYSVDMSLKAKNPMAPNGHAIMYGRTNKPAFSGFEAGADHFLNALYTFDKNGKLTGILANVPSPAQLSLHMYLQTADYWADVRKAVKKEFGEDVYLLTQCAAAGDIDPRTLYYDKAQERRLRLKYGTIGGYREESGISKEEYQRVMGQRFDIAERVIEGLKEIYNWAKTDIKTNIPVCTKTKTIDLKKRRITEEEVEWCKENIRQMKEAVPDSKTATPDEINVAVTNYKMIKMRNERVLTRYETQDEEPCEESDICAVRIGDVAFCTNEFEYFIDYMHRIQSRSPFLQTFVVQLAGPRGGYISTKKATENKGYSASLFCNRFGYEAGQQIVEESLKLLEELKNGENE